MMIQRGRAQHGLDDREFAEGVSVRDRRLCGA